MSSNAVVATVRNVLQNIPKSWVMFKHHSVVVVSDPSPDKSLEEQATEIIKRDGPVYAGTPHGDFNVMGLVDNQGWIVTSHNKDLFTYVQPDDSLQEQMMIGLHGRGKRQKDGQAPEIIHVEIKQAQDN